MMEKCNCKEGSLGTQHHLDACGEIFQKGRKTDSVNCTRTHSQLSTSSTMSQNFSPDFVSQRRSEQNADFTSIFTITIQQSNLSQSTISSEAPPVEPRTVATDTLDRVLNISNANEKCSSSKSNLELSSASLKFDTDDAAEFSSSGVLVKQKVISAKDICISFLKNQGLLYNTIRRRQKKSGVRSEKHCLKKACGVCGRVQSTLNMLLCDDCEDGFHVFCYSPVITVLPVGAWLCGCCLKKKHEILKGKLSSAGESNNVDSEVGRDQWLGLEGELGSLEFMFRDTEPYMSNARIGDEFQAKVPHWSGPIDEECGVVGDPLAMAPYDHVNLQGGDSINHLKLSNIGNWLQCRAVIKGVGDGSDGNICSKWRRAPLFEVQTDKWECFCCILWDPARADCAAPQELETEEVKKQLKYIEMLRPRLSAKRRKADSRSKSNGSQDRPQEKPTQLWR